MKPPAEESARSQQLEASGRAVPAPPASEPGDDAHAVRAFLSSGLLRFTCVIGIVAGALGRTVLPGLRGNAPERTVLLWERVSSILSYTFWLLLSTLVVRSALEIGRQGRVGSMTRLLNMAGAGIVVAILLRALSGRLEVPLAVAISSAAVAAALSGGLRALRSPPTRAVGGMLVLLASSAFLRLVAWQLAAVAGDRASPSLYDAGRVVATIAVVVEGSGQLVGATWIGSRARVRGQLVAGLAVAFSFVITWAAARGAHAGAGFFESMLHHGLADAPGVPPPFQLGAFATFLVPSGSLLALAAVIQWNPLAAIPCAACLALVGHGSYDVPLRALAATAAGQWMLLASTDPRSMWVALTSAPASTPALAGARTEEPR